MKKFFVHELPASIKIDHDEFKNGLTIHLKSIDSNGTCKLVVSLEDATPTDSNENVTLADSNKKSTSKTSEPTEPSKRHPRRIPGHPNCYYGECDAGCHVVSCPIYQGYEKSPLYEDCIPCGDEE